MFRSNSGILGLPEIKCNHDNPNEPTVQGRLAAGALEFVGVKIEHVEVFPYTDTLIVDGKSTVFFVASAELEQEFDFRAKGRNYEWHKVDDTLKNFGANDGLNSCASLDLIMLTLQEQARREVEDINR